MKCEDEGIKLMEHVDIGMGGGYDRYNASGLTGWTWRVGEWTQTANQTTQQLELWFSDFKNAVIDVYLSSSGEVENMHKMHKSKAKLRDVNLCLQFLNVRTIISNHMWIRCLLLWLACWKWGDERQKHKNRGMIFLGKKRSPNYSSFFFVFASFGCSHTLYVMHISHHNTSHAFFQKKIKSILRNEF